MWVSLLLLGFSGDFLSPWASQKEGDVIVPLVSRDRFCTPSCLEIQHQKDGGFDFCTWSHLNEFGSSQRRALSPLFSPSLIGITTLITGQRRQGEVVCDAIPTTGGRAAWFIVGSNVLVLQPENTATCLVHEGSCRDSNLRILLG